MNKIYSLICVLLVTQVYAKPVSTSYPYISGDTFRALADYVIDDRTPKPNPKAFKNNAIIFVKTDFIEEFFLRYHPHISGRYILITHNSDYGIPGNCAQHLNDPKLIAWFGQNVSVAHEKLVQLPIGIANPYWKHGNIDILTQIIKDTKTTSPKDLYNKLLYMNFSVATNTPIRSKVYQLFASQPYCHKTPLKPWDQYLVEMSQFCFVLSPHGNGLDCHKTWEAMLMGSIPVVTHSSLDPLYKDLPVLIVNKWENVTQEFLIASYKKMSLKTYKMEKLYASYWCELIKSYVPKEQLNI